MNNSNNYSCKETCSNCLAMMASTTPCIKCCDCPATTLLCLPCFCSGSEPPPHSVRHSYSIQGPGSSHGWSLEDTLAMLSVVEQCGYGSWEEVARILPGKHRKPEEIKQHYDAVFVHGDTQFPEIQATSFSALNMQEPHPPQVQYFPLASSGEDPPRPGPGIRQVSGINNLKHSGGWCNKLAGYMPARAEFCQEWDNQGEFGRSMNIM